MDTRSRRRHVWFMVLSSSHGWCLRCHQRCLYPRRRNSVQLSAWSSAELQELALLFIAAEDEHSSVDGTTATTVHRAEDVCRLDSGHVVANLAIRYLRNSQGECFAWMGSSCARSVRQTHVPYERLAGPDAQIPCAIASWFGSVVSPNISIGALPLAPQQKTEGFGEAEVTRPPGRDPAMHRVDQLFAQAARYAPRFAIHVGSHTRARLLPSLSCRPTQFHPQDWSETRMQVTPHRAPAHLSLPLRPGHHRHRHRGARRPLLSADGRGAQAAG